jgi:hypothetical protein
MRGKLTASVVLVTLSLLAFSLAITAQDSDFDANLGFQWLVNHCPNGNCKDDIMTTAFYTLAMRDSGALDYANQGYNYIKSQEDSDHCFPKGSCKTKDTAFAMWVMNEFGDDISETEDWLIQAVSAAPELRNDWYLEVITTNDGTCKVSYDKDGTNVQKDIVVSQGSFPECSSSPVPTFFDLDQCLEPNLLNKYPSLEIDINCNDLGPSTTMTILFTTGSEYHLIAKTDTPREIFTIENGCFGASSKSSCNFDSTLFTNWLLFTVGSDLSTNLYLQNKYDPFKALDNTLMFLSTNDPIRQTYIEDLEDLQRNDGSFNKQVFDTAMAVLALREGAQGSSASDATAWLESKQDSDGSWETSELKTATTLYTTFAGAAISIAPPITGSGGGPIFDCGDGFCDPEFENENNCPDDCKSSTVVCEVNGICEYYLEENSLNCAQDCYCGDTICDSAETEFTCPDDCETTATATCGNGIIEGSEECDMDPNTGFGDDFLCPDRCQVDCNCGVEEEKGGFPWWIIIVILAVIIVLVVVYVKMKGKNIRRKPMKKPVSSFGLPPTRPLQLQPPMTRLQTKQKKSKLDEELDKSIKEAKKLLKKI